MKQKIPSLTDIELAHKRIAPFINLTPVLTSTRINNIIGANLFFKCENFQKVGAFKYRGATNAVLSLNENELQKGVATHSSGNHAAALALAAKNKNVPAYIVIPENAPEIKKKAVAGYGAKITFCEPTLQAREDNLASIVKQTGATFIHPYNKFEIICGQATAAKELLEEVKNLDIVIAPVGGGGLLSGTAISCKEHNPKIEVIAAEPKGADDAFRSFYQNELLPSINPNTICDGLLSSLGELTFATIQKYVDEIVTVEEKTIIEAMRMIWERMKIIVEPSAAVPLAAILENKEKFEGKRIGFIISGGNVDLEKLPL